LSKYTSEPDDVAAETPPADTTSAESTMSAARIMLVIFLVLFILIPPFHFLVPAAKLSIMLLSVVLFADHHSSEGGFSMPRNPDIG
jgi:hypothetical protein